MREKTPGPRHFPVIPLLAPAIILLGLLAISGAFAKSQQLLLSGQDGQLTKTAQSVDNNIMGHSAWYCSDLEYITSRTAFLAAEELYLSGGKADSLLYHLRESPLPKTVMVEFMLVLRGGRVAVSTGGRTDYTRLAVLPAPGNENGCFTVGVSRNYDEIIRPYQAAAVQMVLCGVIVMGGAALLLFFLLRSRRSHRQAQRELVLLRAKAEAAEQLNAQTQALAHRQRLESIGTLTSGIAHEFNNLLTPIMGYSILILEKLPPEDTESYDNALEIYNASQKAKKIIARLSNLSRKGTPGDLRPIRLDALVEQVLQVAAPAKPKTVRVEIGLSGRDQALLGDETQLFQLTLNLVLNSFEALAPEGGVVRISTASDGARIALRVADNGPGIPDEVKKKIFDPFFTTKGSGKGIGLGLAIVQQIVEAHGAVISLESAAGQGTAFTVTFPAVPPGSSAASSQ